VEVNATGGISFDWWFRASWPFATLRATSSRLSLSSGFFGSWEFTAEEVLRLQARRSFFGLSGGVEIVHANEEYPNEIVFWIFGRPDPLIRRIGAAGFRPHPGSEQFAAAARIGKRGAMPVRWSFLLGSLALWNGLFLLDFYLRGDQRGLGPLSLLAMALVVFVSFWITRSSRLQDLVMKPGRSAYEIFPLIRIAQLFSGIMLAAIAIAYLFA